MLFCGKPLGHFTQCLTTLEKVVALQTEPEPYTLLIKAMCLDRLDRSADAQAAFDQAEAIMQPSLSESVGRAEGFLPAWQVYQQLRMYREAKAVFSRPEPKP